jgi:predicted MFS family arabinose efflux permease
MAEAPTLRGLAATHLRLYSSAAIAAPAFGWLFYTFSYVSLLTLLPPFLDPATRDLVIGAIPLIGIVVSLTLGVWLLRVLPAVRVVQIGFATAALSLAGLFVWQGAPLFCAALAAALGLVQGASFAAVAQLNATGEARALANGAMAQAGNIGNSVGTPIMAFAIVQSGYGAMMALAVLAMICGVLGHGLLARRRAMAVS